jgi:hypothetical protein
MDYFSKLISEHIEQGAKIWNAPHEIGNISLLLEAIVLKRILYILLLCF